MTFEEKISALNTMAKAWYSTSQADALHEAIFRAQGLGKFADHCKEESEEELEEAKKCSARIAMLGGKPEFGFMEQPVFDDPKALLEDWAKATEEGIVDLNKLAASITGDSVTRRLIEEFVEGEEDHCKWVHQHLALIEKIGYENYLIEMMDI